MLALVCEVFRLWGGPLGVKGFPVLGINISMERLEPRDFSRGAIYFRRVLAGHWQGTYKRRTEYHFLIQERHLQKRETLDSRRGALYNDVVLALDISHLSLYIKIDISPCHPPIPSNI
jgi:hypothetical protein